MILLLVVYILVFCPACQSLDYCVVPDTGDCVNCTLLFSNVPCHTLQYYANNFFTSNSIFHFLEGEHTLSTVVQVMNVANLFLVGIGPHPNLNRIQCTVGHAWFEVVNFANFTMENITFNCNQGDFAFILRKGSGLRIDHIAGSSISATGLRGRITISNSRFSLSSITDYDYPDNCVGHAIHISINNCEIAQPGWETGLKLEIGCPNGFVNITNLVIEGGQSSLGIWFWVLTGNFIEVSNITIRNGAGVAIFANPGLDSSSCGPNATHQPHYLMKISNMKFANIIRALYIRGSEIDCNAQYILIKDSVITNTNLPAAVLGSEYLQITFKNIIFSSITAKQSDSDQTIIAIHMLNVTFTDCTFENNQMTAILALGTKLIFQGNNTFRNNSAINGAGIMLLQNSYMHLHDNTNITFADNHASAKGGAMYVDSGYNVTGNEFCMPCSILYSKRNQVHFINNTAGTAGSSLYWITMDFCYSKNGLGVPIADYFKNLSHLQNTESDPSAISSDPIRICQCKAEHYMPNCSSAYPPISTYPGQDFILHLAVVGTMDGTVPGTIHAKFPPSSPQARLGDLQATQMNQRANCNDVTYTVYSSNSSVYFHLTATEYSTILNISVDLKPCPIGFALRYNACKCDHVLSQEGIRCFINNQSILRPTNTWIGFNTHLDNSSKTRVVFSEHCPHGYCLPHDVYLSGDDPDIQCADNRTGVLCGQCVKNYSLTLGGHKCRECSNLYILLLFPLAASGLVLVAVLFVLNLTVTEGTINGLIFYANVISMTHSTRTSSQLYTFIAWLNLDLGIDTCFCDGMDAYTETWLQFAFPLYLWLIIAAIIALCKALPQKFTGRGTQNAVKVLVTLLLLSYTKLQRTLVTIFSFTTLRYPSGAVHYVWLYDANVHFLKGKHIYLFTAGVLVLGLLVLPYTFGLALFQYLQACSGHRVCWWVNKLKPVFDAYAGPYKDRFRMWTGLLLVTRTLLIIFISFNIIITDSPNFNHFVTLITCLALLLLSTRGIYRKWPCDVLEAFFYIQLGIFSAGTIYASHNNGNVAILANLSFATTLLVFLVIVWYHAFKEVICCCKNNDAVDPEEEEQLLFQERELYHSLIQSHPCNTWQKRATDS